jgi:hypothetical protein
MHQTQANVNTCVWHSRGRLKHCRCWLKLAPRTLTRRHGKTLQEHPRSSKALGDTPAGALARPYGIAQQPEGKKVPSASANPCGFLTDTTAEARGLLSSPNEYAHKSKTHSVWSRPRAKKGHSLRRHNGPPKIGRGTPWVNLRLARGPGTTPQISASLEGLMHPRARLRLAQGPDAPSGETLPRSRPP